MIEGYLDANNHTHRVEMNKDVQRSMEEKLIRFTLTMTALMVFAIVVLVGMAHILMWIGLPMKGAYLLSGIGVAMVTLAVIFRGVDL